MFYRSRMDSCTMDKKVQINKNSRVRNVPIRLFAVIRFYQRNL